MQETSVTGTLGFTYVNDTRERGVDPSAGLGVFPCHRRSALETTAVRFVKSEARAGYEMAVLNENVTLKADGRVGLLHMVDGRSRYREPVPACQRHAGVRAW